MTKEFDPAFDMPNTPAQALAVLEAWGHNGVLTFSPERSARCAELLKPTTVILTAAIDARTALMYSLDNDSEFWLAIENKMRRSSIFEAYLTLTNAVKGIPIPEQDSFDWDVIVEAIYDAVGNGEGNIVARYIKQAFAEAGIILLKDGPDPLIVAPEVS